ncbi:MAG: hypothetical protein GWP08_08105 [Nitrospiraceae bacterium]|nr:hypothetical protein [Nitrospiraceae bacterium]
MSTSAVAKQAHTTPAYVVRPGLRFWKHDEVETFVNKCLGHLDEIEDLVHAADLHMKIGKVIPEAGSGLRTTVPSCCEKWRSPGSPHECLDLAASTRSRGEQW